MISSELCHPTKHLFQAATVALCTSWGMAAQAFDDQDQAEIDALAAEYTVALEAQDYETLVTLVPREIFAEIAQSVNMDVDTLLLQVVAQLEMIMSGVETQNFAFDMDANPPQTTSTGREYLLVPTSMSIVVPGQSIVDLENTTIFFEDNDEWRMARIEDAQQIDIFVTVFPDFADVSIPAPQIMQR